MMASQPNVEELLAGPLRDVFEDTRRKFREFQTRQAEEPFWSVLQGFFHAIDWKEPWIISLVVTHVALLVLVLATRKNLNLQAALFALAMLFVYFGERINRLGSQHWDRFSRQDYFDPRGAFYSAMVSGPLLVVMFAVLINYLLSCTSLLIKAKRMELKHKARHHRQQEVINGSGGALAQGQSGGAGRKKDQ